jgi:hypothetical protein
MPVTQLQDNAVKQKTLPSVHHRSIFLPFFWTIKFLLFISGINFVVIKNIVYRQFLSISRRISINFKTPVKQQAFVSTIPTELTSYDPYA